MLIQTDYVGWLNETITLLKQKNFDQVDWENLIEEIESLGRSQKRELRNRLTTILEQCLKLCYTECRCTECRCYTDCRCYTECRCTECRYTECCCTECRCTECCCTECRCT